MDTVAQDIQRDMVKCFQCGACTAVCPKGALHIERLSMRVLFDPETYSQCEHCVSTCPVRARIVSINRAL